MGVGEIVGAGAAPAPPSLRRADLTQFARTAMEAPEWFTVGTGAGAKVRARRGEIPAGQRALVDDAVEFCPTRALRIAEEVLAGAPRSLTNGATYFHTTGVRPSWSKRFTRTTRIGSHIFYRRGGSQRVASN